MCGWFFKITHYTDLVDGAVLEAKVDAALLSKPVSELIKHMQSYKWKFYKSEEEGKHFILSFVGI